MVIVGTAADDVWCHGASAVAVPANGHNSIGSTIAHSSVAFKAFAVGVSFIDSNGFACGGKAHFIAPFALVVSIAVGTYLGGVSGGRGKNTFFIDCEGVAVGHDEVGFIVVQANLPSGLGWCTISPAEGSCSSGGTRHYKISGLEAGRSILNDDVINVEAMAGFG